MQYKKNDIIQLTHNVVVKSHSGDFLQVTDIDRDMDFTIHGEKLISSVLSADYFKSTEKLGKVALAEKLIQSNGRVLTICFNKENGEERVLRGIFQGNESLMGRSYVVDLDKDDAHPRLVNHRSISWLILDNVKYIKK